MHAIKSRGILLLAVFSLAITLKAGAQTSFTFTAPGFFYSVNGSGVNPMINLTQGVTYTININTTGSHPMYFSTTAGLGPNYYNQCPSCFSTNLMSSPQSSITFQFTPSTAGTFYYVCAFHVFFGQVNVAAAPAAPSVTTVPANVVSHSSAQLNASINPNSGATTAYFDYGATTNFDSSTILTNLSAGSSPVVLNALLNNLSPGTTYFYRAVGSNALGKVNGSSLSFLVPPPPGIANILPQPNGAFLLQSLGATGMSYTVLGSTNLRDWSTLTNLSGGAGGQFDFLDTDATNYSQRFYWLRNP